jgi:hypothetical protein
MTREGTKGIIAYIQPCEDEGLVVHTGRVGGEGEREKERGEIA